MSKRIGITLIVVALVIAISYAIVGVLTFEDCPIKTTTPTEIVEKEYKAELVYNSLMYNSGAYEYSIGASINVGKLLKKATVPEQMAITQQSKDAIMAIKDDWQKRGYKITKEEDYAISAVIAYYQNYDQLALANGQTGYDKVEGNSSVVYRGWFYNNTVLERNTVFKQEEGSVLNIVEGHLNTVDGVELGDVSLVFNYGTMYKTSTISSDADQIYQLNDAESGIFTIIHEFRMTNDNRGRVITLVQTNPNVYTWYFMPIVVSLLLAGVTILIAGARRSK